MAGQWEISQHVRKEAPLHVGSGLKEEALLCCHCCCHTWGLAIAQGPRALAVLLTTALGSGRLGPRRKVPHGQAGWSHPPNERTMDQPGNRLLHLGWPLGFGPRPSSDILFTKGAPSGAFLPSEAAAEGSAESLGDRGRPVRGGRRLWERVVLFLGLEKGLQMDMGGVALG